MADLVKTSPNGQLPATAANTARDGFVRESVSPNTLRAYRGQFELWKLWCKERELEAVPPATPEARRV